MKYYGELGLKDWYKKCRGSSFKCKLSQLRHELEIAWERVWYGYSYVDVIGLNRIMGERIAAILKEYRDDIPFVMFDPDSHKELSKEEAREVFDKLIRYIEIDMDEDYAYKHLYGCYMSNDEKRNEERLKKAYECKKAHQRYGFKLLQKYWDQLWW